MFGNKVKTIKTKNVSCSFYGNLPEVFPGGKKPLTRQASAPTAKERREAERKKDLGGGTGAGGGSRRQSAGNQATAGKKNEEERQQQQGEVSLKEPWTFNYGCDMCLTFTSYCTYLSPNSSKMSFPSWSPSFLAPPPSCLCPPPWPRRLLLNLPPAPPPPPAD